MARKADIPSQSSALFFKTKGSAMECVLLVAIRGGLRTCAAVTWIWDAVLLALPESTAWKATGDCFSPARRNGRPSRGK